MIGTLSQRTKEIYNLLYKKNNLDDNDSTIDKKCVDETIPNTIINNLAL